jgi:hypothetical protein
MTAIEFTKLPQLITVDRDRVHEDLSMLLVEGSEDGAIKLARADPSLFCEPIDSRLMAPAALCTRAGYVASRSTTFTWAMTAAESGMDTLMDVLLAAGVHPNDPSVFMKVPLMSHSAWFFKAENSRKILKLGARPDSPNRWADGGKTIGQWLVKRLESGLAHAGQAAECLEVLIDAGARDLSPEPGRHVAFLLARAPSGFTTGGPLVDEKMREVARLFPALKRAGLPIDQRDKDTYTTPLTEAIRAKNRIFVEMLVECDAKWRDVVSAAGTMVEEVELSFGVEGRAWFMEALMRAEVASCRAPSASVNAAPTPRRGLRAPV